jgi:hypothetical protein
VDEMEVVFTINGEVFKGNFMGCVFRIREVERVTCKGRLKTFKIFKEFFKLYEKVDQFCQVHSQKPCSCH